MQLVLLPLQTSCSCPGLIPQCCREHAEAEGLGSMRRTKEGLACDTKCRFGELDTSHRVVTVCVCVLILGRKQDKKANPLHQSSRPLPHYVFLDVVFSSLSELPCWYELESSQSISDALTCSKAKAPNWGFGGPAEALQRWAQPSALPDSCAPWDFLRAKGGRGTA